MAATFGLPRIPLRCWPAQTEAIQYADEEPADGHSTDHRSIRYLQAPLTTLKAPDRQTPLIHLPPAID